MGEPARRMTVEEAMALGNEGVEKALAEGRGADYMGLIAFACRQTQKALDVANDSNRQNRVLIEMNEKLIAANTKLVARVEQLEGTILDFEQEVLEEGELSLQEGLRGLLESEGAPKLAVLSVIRYLNETKTS